MQPLRYVHSHIEISTQLFDEAKRAEDAFKELENDPEKLAAWEPPDDDYAWHDD